MCGQILSRIGNAKKYDRATLNEKMPIAFLGKSFHDNCRIGQSFRRKEIVLDTSCDNYSAIEKKMRD